MIQKFTGKVVNIEKDSSFLNQEIAEMVTTKGRSMFFFVKRLKVKVGDTVEIEKEHNEMGYLSITVI